ncbi:MAG: basic amino acid/polyamine antiporter, family [Blastocatellia bacterium]|jgi:amino acid transporter|nr:basic amino acid/polyamine antiporter, family [Blastocatellia bacterium]
MAAKSRKAEKEDAPLLRRFGLLQAVALNMSNMIGVGPFITIPLLMSALGGPQAMLGWIVAVLIAIPDGMVWSELGAAMPGSGGSYLYLREGYGRETFGRLMAFLFIWQFILSGPLEIASGYIGFARYTAYIWTGMTQRATFLVAAGVGVVNIVLLYRRITSIGTITVSLWIGTLLTTLAVMITGAMHFSAARAFDFPPGAFTFSLGFLFGLGAASRVGVYDYLGYYDICYIGDEVRDPGRTIPRSIIISVIAVAIIYLAINLSVIGVVPWRQFVPWDKHPESGFLVSAMMEKIYGTKIATVFTAMVLWTAFGSVFALLLGYSRIPYAAALDGYFFKVFGRLHPTKRFPYVALIVLGVISIVCSFFSLDTVIDALISTRILVQFVGQILALILLRKRAPNMRRPYKMWLYPLPCLVALIGWIFIFATTAWPVILLGLGTLSLGAVFFFVWSWYTERWPFASVVPDTAE